MMEKAVPPSTSQTPLHTPAYTCNGQALSAEAFYAIACDPARSVAIEACAGAGKTWMLVSRILRALLLGTKPEAILAITYTRKAAGEMRERLQEWLHAFAHELDDDKLIAEMMNRGISAQQAPPLLPQLRALHAQLLGHSRSVEIRTFHSWFAQLLRAAPLGVLVELDLPAQYELIEDDSELFDSAWYALLQTCVKTLELKEDLEALMREQGSFNTREALKSAWARRIEFSLADAQGVVEASVANAPDVSVILMGEPFVQRWLGYAKALGQEKTVTPQNAANALELALTLPDVTQRLAALRLALFVKTGDRLSKNLQKFEAAQQAEIELIPLLQQHAQHQAYVYQQHMLRLTRALLKCYAQIKREQGVIDMADLERVALRLLGDTETYGWVAQRLDASISQVLIDEFQDTNPLQWQALRGWLSGYAGAGGGGKLSVFIVGDPKQSIYRFRRADPAVFRAACDFLQHTLGGSMLACDHTRRNAPEVMAAVNAVFMQAQQGGEFESYRVHTTAAQHTGAVERLPLVVREVKTPVSATAQAGSNEQVQEHPLWRDTLTQPRFVEEEKLRRHEIRQVADLIGDWLHNQGWKPSDIKVLSRKKERLRELLVELNHRGIAWRFADDVDLIETQEVQDIAALLDVLASTTHDLSLAQTLRSPIFGLDDEALMVLCEQVNLGKERLRTEKQIKNPMLSWWCVLQEAVKDAPVFNWPEPLRHAAKQLATWKALAQKLPPHDLLDVIYSQADLPARYAKAVPEAMREEVLTNLRALLQQALLLDGGRYATPYNFVRALRGKDIKSEHPEGGESVELLTVHGAKGLEARGIILLDTDPAASRVDRLSALMDWPAENSAPVKFVFYTSKKNLGADAQILLQHEDAADKREELNALYVAMTRAKERLVFSALQARGSTTIPSWWHRLDDLESVEPLNAPVFTSMPAPAQADQQTPVETTSEHVAGQTFMHYVLPTYQSEQVASNVADGVFELIKAETGLLGIARTAHTTAVSVQASNNAETMAQRFGNAVHRLLELGNFTPEHIQNIANEMALDTGQISNVLSTVQTILTHPKSSVFFNAKHLQAAYNEIELCHEGQVLRIDRLVQMDGHWWVLDFKSAANPLGKRNAQYRQQLSDYKKALAAIYPDAVIHTALIAGNGEVIEITEHESTS